MSRVGTGIMARTAGWLLLVLAPLVLTGCGGGGSGASGSTPTPTPTPTVTTPTPTISGSPGNAVAVTVDAGPAALNTGPNAYTSTNAPYVTITICALGSTSTCQTIDHVLVDTGSVGLRLEAGVLNSALLAAMPAEMDASNNPVGECYTFVDSYMFGSVRTADFSIGGESVAAMPVQIVGDAAANFATPPTSCSSGGGTNQNTVQTAAANGIMGIGTTPTDCGSNCATTNQTGTIYYDCPASGCSAITARNSVTAAPFQQLPNPVAAFAKDNNGSVLSLPGVAPAGVVALNGALYFGIGTETNNGLGTAKILTTDTSGLLTANFNAMTLNSSFIDSGSPYYYFVDTGITACLKFKGFYCPAAPVALSPTLTGLNGVTASAAFTLYNVETQPAGTSNAIPGIGANPSALAFTNPINNSFDFGLPFFFGRNVYVAIYGRAAVGTVGPYVAF